MSNNRVFGFAGRYAVVQQSRLDAGFVTLEFRDANENHLSSMVLTPKGAAELSQLLENHAQKALALGLKAELLQADTLPKMDLADGTYPVIDVSADIGRSI